MINTRDYLKSIIIHLLVILVCNSIYSQEILTTVGLSLDTGFNTNNPVDFPTGNGSDFWYEEKDQKPTTGFGFKMGVRKKVTKILYLGISSSYRRYGLEERGIAWGGITGGGNEYQLKRIINSVSLAPSISFQLNTK